MHLNAIIWSVCMSIFNQQDEKFSDDVWDFINEGGTLKDIHSIPDEAMDGMYAHAYNFYKKGQLDDAETFFRFLCMYNFYNPEYFFGLAAVYQLKKNYQKACDLYAVAFAMMKDDYRPVFFSGQCQLLMGNKPVARNCFSLVCEQSKDPIMVSKSEAYLKVMSYNDADSESKTDKTDT